MGILGEGTLIFQYVNINRYYAQVVFILKYA